MNENETPLEGAQPADVLAALDATVDASSQAAAEAAAEIDAAIETLAGATAGADAPIAEAEFASARAAEVTGLPAPATAWSDQDEPDAPRSEPGARKQTLTDRLTESQEFDPAATDDDRTMAALAYASHLIFPLGLILPIILLISETSKVRPFQRYHAVQSLALSAILSTLTIIYTLSWVSLGWIAFLCLCLVAPIFVALWLLPLYYAMLAYNGKRFRIVGLTQFLEDQRWL